MDVILLGTGAAPGWPHPWCDCDSCRAAMRAGVIRTPVGALVDGRVLIECGPEVPRQAVRFGASLSDVHTVLVTHVHTDHFDPAFLLYRSYESRKPLRVVGPAPVIATASQWLAPGQDMVSLVQVTAGDVVEVEGYRVEVLPADHSALGECVLYALAGPDGVRLLWATDTGPAARLPTLAPVDMAFVEQTFGPARIGADHLDDETFGGFVDRLRSAGAVTAATRVIAVHLSHHHDFPAEVRGAEVVPDGTRIELPPKAGN